MSTDLAREPAGARSRVKVILAGAALLGLIAAAAAVLYGPSWAAYQYWQAGRAIRDGDLERARACLRLYLDARPESAEAQFLAARTARRAGAFDEAQEHLNRARRFGHDEEALQIEWALLAVQGGDIARGEPFLRTLLAKDHPDGGLILEGLAKSYMRLYDLPRAIALLDEWLQKDPDSGDALALRGQCYIKLIRYDDALADFRRAAELAPRSDDVRLDLANLLIKARQTNEAVGHVEELFRRQPRRPEVLLGLARCRNLQGRFDEAAEILDRVLAERPDEPKALAERGFAALQQENPEEAERWLRRAAALAPYEPDILYAFCQCLNRVGKSDEAKAWATRLSGSEEDLTRMGAVARQIVQQPRDPGLRHEAGRLMLRNGLTSEGLRWLHSALQIDPGHRDTHLALAEHFEKQGRKDRADSHRRAAAGGEAPAP